MFKYIENVYIRCIPKMDMGWICHLLRPYIDECTERERYVPHTIEKVVSVRGWCTNS